jgi:lipopolysaccharide export LptBFGC system permease protein LptF
VTLQLYVLRQLGLSFAFAIGGICFIVLPGLSVAAVHRLQGAGVEAMLKFLPLLAADLVPFLVPMSFLLAVVSTFGRMAADHEWTALRMAGINPIWTLVPCAILALLLGLGTNHLLTSLTPRWSLKQRTQKHELVADALRTLFPGRTRFQAGPYLLSASGRKGNTFEGVLLYLPDDDKGASRVIANRAEIGLEGDSLRVELEGARWIRGGQDVASENPIIKIPTRRLVQAQGIDRNRPRYLTSRAIEERLKDPELTPETRRLLRYEFHARNALAASFLLFLGLGAPTGVWLRKGTQLAAFSVAVGYALIYYLVSLRVGEELGRFSDVPPALAAWGPTVVGLLIGAFMVRRMVRS